MSKNPTPGRATVLTVRAGAGGRDAEDWTGMLVRMYCRWAEARRVRIDVVETQNGAGGLRHATLLAHGPEARAVLSAECGVHRLIRRSPFSRNAKRQTAFASVSAIPEPEQGGRDALDHATVRVETFCASGAGGQHVNRAMTAVRMTHGPTGIQASAQGERSQSANRKAAGRVLAARVAAHAAERDAPGRAAEENAFARQRRTYTLHPQQMVSDTLSGIKTNRADQVLDGRIELIQPAARKEATR